MRAAHALLAAGLTACLLLPQAVHAHSQARSPGTCISYAIGGNPNWINPDRAETNNGQFATSTIDDNQLTDGLACIQYGFAIPAGATVFGIIVKLERRTSATAGVSPTRDSLMRIVKGGVAEPADRATTTNYTTADVIEDHGTAADLWGTTWTPAEINDPNFGAGFAAFKNGTTGGTVTVSVDHMQIEVHYSEPPPAPTLVSPADGATVATGTPTFTWNAAADPDGDTVTYQIQADDSGCSFASPEIDQSGIGATTFTPGAALANGVYCWRVRAVDQHGLAGPWSATRSVTVNVPLSQTRSPAAGACTNQAGIGTIAWGATGNAVSSNGSYASATVDGQTTNYLRCLSYAFSIPAGATIVGIEVNVERKSDRTQNGGSEDAAMRLVKAGTIQATDRSSGTIYTTGDVVEPHGSPTDLWGTTWTPAEINAATFGAAFAAVKANSAGNPHVITVDHIAITVHYTVPIFVAPGNFNAFETGTAAGAISGVIVTKVAGTAFSLDVVAITSGAQEALFTSAVRVELLGNTALGVALDVQNCPTSFTLLQTVAPDPAITAGRSTVAFAAVPNAWRDVRVRVSYPAGAPTVTSCSTDNFAVRPASFALAASDSDWQSAGTTRVLNNTGAAGGAVHKAGRAFRLTVTPAPATTTNYAGDPTPGGTVLACSLPTPCANGTLALGTFTAAGGGVRVSDTATYSEAGAFNLTLRDETYASVDAGDTPGNCTASGRYICQSPAPLAVGRFVPDRFAITAGTAPVLRTFDTTDAACSVPPSGPRRSFTYIGQPFGYVTAPTGTVEAQNATGGTTANYRGALWKLTAAADVSQTFTNTPAKPITPTLGTPTLTEIANSGTGTLSANAADKIAFDRDSATPSAPFNADLMLRWSVADDAENGANQGIITTATPLDFTSIAFDAGNAFRYGRLRLGNANGSHLTPLPVVMEAQYALLANSFVTNTADHCTSIANANVAMGTFSGNLVACETAVTGAGTLSAGRRTLVLPAPGSANDGAVILSVNLGAAAAGTTCTVVGGGTVAAGGANRPYLQGSWAGVAYDDDPTARATFGTFKGAGEVIFMRENF